MRKTIFTERELTEKGFNKVVEGGFVNFEYVFNPEDYLNSKFLATIITSNLITLNLKLSNSTYS